MDDATHGGIREAKWNRMARPAKRGPWTRRNATGRSAFFAWR